MENVPASVFMYRPEQIILSGLSFFFIYSLIDNNHFYLFITTSKSESCNCWKLQRLPTSQMAGQKPQSGHRQLSISEQNSLQPAQVHCGPHFPACTRPYVKIPTGVRLEESIYWLMEADAKKPSQTVCSDGITFLNLILCLFTLPLVLSSRVPCWRMSEVPVMVPFFTQNGPT